MAYYEHYFVEPNRSSGVNEIELQVLIDLARQKRFRWYLEVGVWRLGTLCAVAEASSAKLRCIGIDAFGKSSARYQWIELASRRRSAPLGGPAVVNRPWTQ